MGIVFMRILIVFTVLLCAMRLMGKRQLGELELNELVVAVLITNIVAHPLQDIGIPMLNGLVPAVTLFCCEVLLSSLSMHSIRVRKLLCGTPAVLVENGVIQQRAMRENRLTLDELAEELRGQSITDITSIQYAILETDGRLNTILYPDKRPVTAQQLRLAVPDAGYPVIVIENGRVLEENLRRSGHDRMWLLAQVKKRGAADFRQVYILSVDGQDNIYFLRRE